MDLHDLRVLFDKEGKAYCHVQSPERGALRMKKKET